MEKVLINSTTAMVKVANAEFGGELNEVEKLAEYINQYGNIKAYTVDKEDTVSTITFILDKSVNKI